MGARSWSTPSPPSPGLPSGPPQPSCGQSPATTPPLSPQPCSRKAKHHNAAAQWQTQHMVSPNGSTVPTLSVLQQQQQQQQQLERHLSVRQDLALDLPPCLALPDGEERPYGASTRLRIRDYDQESEIYRECIRPPPNRTVSKSQDSTPFRSKSYGILSESAPCKSSGGGSSILCWKNWDKEDSRSLIEPDGLPAVFRSKSTSLGSGSSTTPLVVMVPTSKRPSSSSGSSCYSTSTVSTSSSSPSSSSCCLGLGISSATSALTVAVPSNKRSTAASSSSVKSRMRLLCEKVTSSVRTDKTAATTTTTTTTTTTAAATTSSGVVNAGFESCTTLAPHKQSANPLTNFSSSSSSGSSGSKLATIPVLPCAAATQSPVNKGTS